LQLGGSILRPKTAVPKTAWYGVVSDPEGNIFAVWQADPAAMPEPEPDNCPVGNFTRKTPERLLQTATTTNE
jgi:hypothetical protein